MITTGATQHPKRSQRRTALLIAVAVVPILLCCGVPAAITGALTWQATMKSSAGAAYPSIAIGEFMYRAFDQWATREPIVNVVCDRHERAVLRNVTDYRAELDAAAAEWRSSYKFTLGRETGDQDGDKATLRVQVVEDWTAAATRENIIGDTHRRTREWTFEVVRERGLTSGWKVCGFSAPPVDG